MKSSMASRGEEEWIAFLTTPPQHRTLTSYPRTRVFNSRLKPLPSCHRMPQLPLYIVVCLAYTPQKLLVHRTIRCRIFRMKRTFRYHTFGWNATHNQPPITDDLPEVMTITSGQRTPYISWSWGRSHENSTSPLHAWLRVPKTAAENSNATVIWSHQKHVPLVLISPKSDQTLRTP